MTRERLIADIQSRLHLLSYRDLRLVLAFIRGLRM